LPENAIAWKYAPHHAVFARAAAIVHQGGIGTTAQALASGHPSLVVPFAHDQFDNAERVRRLGAGLSIPRAEYNAKTAEAALASLLGDASYLQGATDIALKLRSEDGAEAAAQAIDRLALSKGL
jgi:UDP:flavonoid glycosyltransferase YjiC (YdhE family)